VQLSAQYVDADFPAQSQPSFSNNGKFWGEEWCQWQWVSFILEIMRQMCKFSDLFFKNQSFLLSWLING
jgi:hypothetical protein